MEFKIIKGVRHYRMNPDEPWKVDNLSQAEMERIMSELKKRGTENASASKKPAGSSKKNNFLENILR